VDNQTISPAAPVTMAAEDKSKNKKTKKNSGLDPKTGMVESAFTKKLRSILFPKDSKRGPWPPRNLLGKTGKIGDQMTAMFSSLFNRLEQHDDLRKGPKDSAQRIVFDMLGSSDWPFGEKNFPVPGKWKGDRLLVFRRYEISCAMALFYRAFNKFGPTGSPTEWPPKN
jgi:hypothetical protein